MRKTILTAVAAIAVAAPTTSALAATTPAPAPVVTVTAADGSATIEAWERVNVAWTYDVPATAKPGDSFAITMPSQLGSFPSGTYPLKNATGEVIGTMAISGRDVTVTLSDYVATHEHVKLSGYITAQANNTLDYDSTDVLDFTLDSVKVPVTIATGTCPDCRIPDPNASKWATYDGNDEITSAIVTGVVPGGHTLTITEVASPGQANRCDHQASAEAWTSQTVWGDPILTARPVVTTLSCDATTRVMTVTSPADGTKMRVFVPGTATAAQRYYRDSATIVDGPVSTKVNAVATRYDAGGSGDGDMTPVVVERVVAAKDEVFHYEEKTTVVPGTPAVAEKFHYEDKVTIVPGTDAVPEKFHYEDKVIVVPGTPAVPEKFHYEDKTTWTKAVPARTHVEDVYRTTTTNPGRWVQRDVYTPLTPAQARAVASFDDDGLLGYHEDRGLWGAKINNRLVPTSTYDFVYVTAADIAKAGNAAKFLGVSTNITSATVGGTYRTAWCLTGDAKPSKEGGIAWGTKHTATQVNVGRCTFPKAVTIKVKVGTRTVVDAPAVPAKPVVTTVKVVDVPAKAAVPERRVVTQVKVVDEEAKDAVPEQRIVTQVKVVDQEAKPAVPEKTVTTTVKVVDQEAVPETRERKTITRADLPGYLADGWVEVPA